MPSSRKQQKKSSPVRSIKRPLTVVVGAGLLVWLLFFDSHSLISRLKWYQEYKTLEVQNEQLRNEIARLEAELGKGLSDEAVEKIAREQFGMRKKNETVYPVVSDND